MGIFRGECIMKLLQRLKSKIAVATMQADKELYFKDISRVIAPSTIEELPQYIKINNEILARCIVAGIPPILDISGYPSDMKSSVVDELLALSEDGYRIAYSFTVAPINTAESMKMLDSAIYHNKVSQESFRDKKGLDKNQQPPLKKLLEEEDFVVNYKELFSGKQRMYHTALIIIFFGESESKIRTAESRIKAILESNRIFYEAPDYRQLDTFLSAMPFPFTQSYNWCELFSYHTSVLLGTRNTNSRSDTQGLLFGEDLKTGKEILIDLSSLSASHMMIVGMTGSGKTYTSLMLLSRAYSMLQKRVIYVTPKSDKETNYRQVCEYFGGSIIDIGVGEKNINPLQILYDENSQGNMINIFGNVGFVAGVIYV